MKQFSWPITTMDLPLIFESVTMLANGRLISEIGLSTMLVFLKSVKQLSSYFVIDGDKVLVSGLTKYL